MPWEYEDWSFQVVCSDCHEIVQNQMEKAHENLALYQLTEGISNIHKLAQNKCEAFMQATKSIVENS